MCAFFDLCIQQNPVYSNQTHSHLLLEAQVVLVVPVHEYKTDEIYNVHMKTHTALVSNNINRSLKGSMSVLLHATQM